MICFIFKYNLRCFLILRKKSIKKYLNRHIAFIYAMRTPEKKMVHMSFKKGFVLAMLVLLVGSVFVQIAYGSPEAVAIYRNKTDTCFWIGNIRSPAEFEQVDELIITWPKENVVENYSCEPFIVQIVAAAQDAVEIRINVNKFSSYSREAKGGIIPPNDDRPTIVLSDAGIPLTNITVEDIMTSSIWIRDYGPNFVIKNNKLSIVDFNYHGWFRRFLDNLYPTRYGNRCHIRSYFVANLCLEFQAGNYISDGKGTAFLCWDRLKKDNPMMSQNHVSRILKRYLGLDKVVFLESELMPEEQYGDQTGHIDMFAKLLDEDTFLVAEWRDGDPWTNGTMAEITNRNAQKLADMGYDIIRIPTIRDPDDPHTIWSYTNSLIINGTNKKVVLVPQYGASEDAEAISIYQNAMPDYKIRGIDSTEIIRCYGAIHCTTITRPMAS